MCPEVQVDAGTLDVSGLNGEPPRRRWGTWRRARQAVFEEQDSACCVVDGVLAPRAHCTIERFDQGIARDGTDQCLNGCPSLWQTFRSLMEQPPGLGTMTHWQAAQDKPAAGSWMVLPVHEPEASAPGACESRPPRDVEMRSQPLHVGDQGGRVVPFEHSGRGRAACPSLVEEYDSISGGLEQAQGLEV